MKSFRIFQGPDSWQIRELRAVWPFGFPNWANIIPPECSRLTFYRTVFSVSGPIRRALAAAEQVFSKLRSMPTKQRHRKKGTLSLLPLGRKF